MRILTAFNFGGVGGESLPELARKSVLQTVENKILKEKALTSVENIAELMAGQVRKEVHADYTSAVLMANYLVWNLARWSFVV
jgi:hypothetical protein